MKKKAFILVLLAALVLICGIGLLHWMFKRPEPRFIPFDDHQTAAYSGPAYIYYLRPRTIRNGKMWITQARKTTNGLTDFHFLFFDIEQRKVLGELVNAEPRFTTSDETKVLCSQDTPPSTNALYRALIASSKKLPFAQNLTAHADEDEEILWLIDLKSGSRVRFDKVYHSYILASPDSCHALVAHSFDGISFHIWDLGNMTARYDTNSFEHADWWDNSHLLVTCSDTNLALYDVNTQNIRPLIIPTQLQKFFVENGLTNNPSSSEWFTDWAGTNYQLYLREKTKYGTANESYLIKIEQPDGQLKLMDTNIVFGGTGHFNESGTFYVSGGWTNFNLNTVYLRDIYKHETRELLPADLNDRRRSLPIFNGSNVLYYRSNTLWEINLDGSNNRRLFPPP